ncbi:MAG: Gfo/Idh/MocA family oxidoreductase [Opitutaceae bacterium]|nr:Gfo/Idh/MocA family oxidoreductase [Opitutaceae bacterium]
MSLVHSTLIVGCGSIGERHLRCFQHTGRTRLTACDTSPALREKMAATYGVPAVADAAEAIAGGTHDTVVICTPAHIHVPLAIRALRAGLHVLIEKPLSTSLAGVDDLLRAHAESGRQAAVAYVLHAHPLLGAARDFVQRGEFGPVLHASVVSGQPFHVFRPAYAQVYYRDRATGGGAIQDALTHMANWMESVVGPTDSVLCDCAHQFLPGVEVEDTVHIAARNGSALVSYSLNQFQAPNESAVQFDAAGGSVRVELHALRWGTCAAGASAWTWHTLPSLERDTLFTKQAGDFLDQVDGQPARVCTLAAAAQTLRFNLAALAAAERGARVSLGEFRIPA